MLPFQFSGFLDRMGYDRYFSSWPGMKIRSSLIIFEIEDPTKEGERERIDNFSWLGLLGDLFSFLVPEWLEEIFFYYGQKKEGKRKKKEDSFCFERAVLYDNCDSRRAASRKRCSLSRSLNHREAK